MKNYEEYIAQRIKNVKKLCDFLPEIEASFDFAGIVEKGCELSLKHSETFDRIKVIFEKSLGHEIEFAECDALFNLMSGLMVTTVDFNDIGSPEAMIEHTMTELQKILPCEGLGDMVGDMKEFTNTIVNEVINPE